MLRALFVFLLLTSSLRADWDQLFSDEEDPTLFHHVNVITGNLNLHMQDTVIEGAKPLPVFRTYSSAGALESLELNQILQKERGGWLIQGGWNILPHANLLIDLMLEPKDFLLYLPEPNGNLVPYVFKSRRGDHIFIFKPDKGFGQCSGTLSAKTNSGNNILELDLKNGEATLFLPDGGTRFYTGQTFRHWDCEHLRRAKDKKRTKVFYYLEREVLPSKHRIDYFYDGKKRLISVTLKNPAGTKHYAWMHLTQKKDPADWRITTSDGKSLHYKTLEFKGIDYLCDVHSAFRPNESNAYIKGRKGIGARIKRMGFGDRIQFDVHYYTPPSDKKAEEWADRPEKKHFETDKVRSLKAPLGPHGEMMTFARFVYHLKVTEVRGIDGHLTRYTHDKGQLLSIEYYNEHDQIASILKFVWDKDRLRAKILLDGQSQPYFSKGFCYDAAGNVVQETLWGALTGTVPGPFVLNADGSLNGAERYCKRYTYLSGFNLPLLEEEDNGFTYRYEYKPNTDLLTAKFTCHGTQLLTREFFFYDQDHLLIAQMIDDGGSIDPNNLIQVTERHITRYDLNPHSGLIHTLTESYLDMASQTECLLKKVVRSYSAENRVIAEAVYDARGDHRYTIHTDYDAQGRIICQTTPLGQQNTYSYDPLGNLLAAKEVSSACKTFTYDPAGRPAAVHEVDHLGTIKSTFTHYDAKGDLLLETDVRGNAKRQTYDPFGRCIATQFPPALDEQGNPHTPLATFSYDLQGNLSSTSLSGGGATHTAYTTLRKPTQITRADGTTLRHIYTHTGTLAQTIQPDGGHSDYLYDIFQRMTSKKVYSAEGELLSAESWVYNAFHLLAYTDPAGLTTQYSYDGAGRKSSELAQSHLITYDYDSLGHLESTREADIAHIQIHDVGGRVSEEWTETPDTRIENRMKFIYDGENRKVQAIRTTSQGDALDQFFYDRESRLSQHVDPLGNTTEFLYTQTHTNELGQYVLQKRTVDPLHHETLETHDALGRLVYRMQKDSQGSTVAQEQLFYDQVGNRTKRISTLYHLHTPQSQTSVHWEYDLMGRVIKESEGSGKTSYFSYDERGRNKQRIQPNGVSIDSAYDGIDRLLEMKSSDGTIHYQYTYAGGPEPIEIADLVKQTLLKREYNLFGQLLLETNAYGLTSTWEYDHHGRCTSYILPDLSSIFYSFKNGHLAEVSRLSSQGYLLYTHRYLDFDPQGNVSEEDLIHNNGSQQTFHDLLERPSFQRSSWFTQSIFYGPSSLVTETHNSLLEDKTYSYDALNQLIQDGNERHAFDSLGNPLDWSINERNQLLETSGKRLEYDSNGNPIKQITLEGTTTYSYDALNRLIALTCPDAKTTSYFYDPFSRLIAEKTDGEELFFLYDKEQEIGAMSAKGALLQLKVIGLGPQAEIGRSVAIELQGVAYAPLHDFQGNIIALISPSQTIVETYQMDAFGREKNLTPCRNPWRFCSKRSTHSLIYFGQRFYDPALGRWLTPDPAGFTDGANLYTYVLNAPLNRLDLFGLVGEARLPQEMLEMNVPLYKIFGAAAIPVSVQLPCEGSLSGVRVNWSVSSKFWKDLHYTHQERRTGMVNIVDHFQELIPREGQIIGLITTQNGICTTKNDLARNVQAISRMVPEGTLIIGMHNPSKGALKDVHRTFQERGGKDTNIVVRTRQFMVAISEMLHKINPDLLWLHIAHSEGGVIGGNACKGMTEEQRGRLKQQLYFLGVGPAKPLSLDYGRGVTNIYSKQDFITGWFALKYRNNPKYDVRFVRCRSSLSERTAYFADHAFLGTTYQEEQFDYIDDLRQKWRFYDGKKN
jgi:RHS repeat-associated protein